VVSRWEGELDTVKLRETMLRPVDSSEAKTL